jgi:multicomponent Na+:H+ antiporter subunit D
MAAQGAEVIDKSAAVIAGAVPVADWLIVLPVVIPIMVGALLMMFRHEIRFHAVVAMLGLGACLAASLALLGAVLAGGPRAMTMGSWLPPFGIAFTADALGATFAVVANFVGLACIVFSTRDIGASGRRYGFYPFLMLMMAGVNGSFLTGDIFNLYVWFEVFVISSFGLLVLGSQRAQIDGTTKYAILNLVATTLFLITTAYLYGVFGTLNMADLALRFRQGNEAAPLVTIAALFLLAFGMKAAAFPLNFWLPASYHTPKIVTAALFGGLLTKIGIYALLRVLVMIMPAERALLSPVVGVVAGATMMIGALGALAQSDVRRLFGYLVISGVGLMLAGIAMGTSEALSGTVFYAVHSMIAMTALYLLGGVMRERAGSFSLHELGGLYREAPFLAGVAILLLLAVAGLPPASGLWPKVMLVRAGLEGGHWWLTAAILVSSLLVTIALSRVFLLAFWRPRPAVASSGAMPETSLPLIGYLTLGLVCVPLVWMGTLPETMARLAVSAAAGLIDPAAYIGAVFPAGAGL